MHFVSCCIRWAPDHVLISAVEPEYDGVLQQLLIHAPWDQSEKELFNDKELQKHIEGFPRGVATKYEFKNRLRGTHVCYPIKRAIALGATLRTVKLMHKIYPPTLRHNDFRSRSTVLHVACAFQAAFDVVEYILKEYPESVYESNSNGYTAHHNTCAYGTASVELVELILRANPDATRKRNKLANTPYISALRNPQADPKVVSLLKERSKEDLEPTDWNLSSSMELNNRGL